MKKTVLYCTCCDTLAASLPPDAFHAALETRRVYRIPAPASTQQHLPADTGIVGFIPCSRLCRKDEADAALTQARTLGAEALVVAACSLSARGFEAARHLGDTLDLEWADIREGCAWLHTGKEAVDKAVDLVFSGLAALEERARTAEPKAAPPVPPKQRVLVIGGGAAGQACAASLAGMGVETVLAERRPTLGGMLGLLGPLFPYLTSGKELAASLTRAVEQSGALVRLETSVSAIAPVPGGYDVTLKNKACEERLTVGAVVLATGAIPVLPNGYYRYGELKDVTSQMEFEVLLGKVERDEESAAALPSRAVFLQCVAARDEKNPYCSAICCPTALKNALRLKALMPDCSVTIVHRNLVTPGLHMERLLRKATAAGVRLISIDPESAPEVLGKEKLEGLRLRNALGGEEIILTADRLVCSTPLKPAPGTSELAKSLDLRMDEMGFASGREPIQPLSPHQAGVYICGGARWPATVEQSLEQGRGAAVRAAVHVAAPIRNEGRNNGQAALAAPAAMPWVVRELLGSSVPEAATARVREAACSRCGRCANVCPYDACLLPSGDVMRIEAARCRSCGSCAAVCPNGAAIVPGDSIGVLRVRIKEALGGNPL
jgi:heterodisulfide reductase subunit A